MVAYTACPKLPDDVVITAGLHLAQQIVRSPKLKAARNLQRLAGKRHVSPQHPIQQPGAMKCCRLNM